LYQWRLYIDLRKQLVMIKRLFAKFIEFRFTDIVNGKPVNLYECKDGTRFMAHSKWDSIFFHVDIEN